MQFFHSLQFLASRVSAIHIQKPEENSEITFWALERNQVEKLMLKSHFNDP